MHNLVTDRILGTLGQAYVTVHMQCVNKSTMPFIPRLHQGNRYDAACINLLIQNRKGAFEDEEVSPFVDTHPCHSRILNAEAPRKGGSSIRLFCVLADTLSKGNEIHDLKVTAQADIIRY